MRTRCRIQHGLLAVPKLRDRRAQVGFSLLEVLIVVAIILIIVAIAAPTIMRSVRSYRFESSGREVRDVIVRARYESMRRNRRSCAAFLQVGAENRYLLDLNGPDTEPCNDAAVTFDAGEPYVVTSTIVEWYRNNAPTLPPLNGLPLGLNDPASVAAPNSYRITFSPRGTLVVPVGLNWTDATQVQFICLIDPPGSDFPRVDAILITVTPVGRVKLYRWRTNQWVEM